MRLKDSILVKNGGTGLRSALCVDGVTANGLDALREVMELSDMGGLGSAKSVRASLCERDMPRGVAKFIFRKWLQTQRELLKFGGGGEPNWDTVTRATRESLRALLDWASNADE